MPIPILSMKPMHYMRNRNAELFAQATALFRALGITMGVGLLCCHSAAQSEWQPFELFRARFIGPDFFIAFMPSNSTQWVGIEISDDLKNWTERASVLTTRQTHGFGESEAKVLPRGFFRTVVPGTGLEEARLRWASRGISHYRFTFQIWPYLGGPITGILTSSGGEKTLANVRYLGTLQPIDEFYPDDFPDIDELFDAIAEATSPGKNYDCQITYDSERSFPLTTGFTIGLLPWRIYTISDFEVMDISTAGETGNSSR